MAVDAGEGWEMPRLNGRSALSKLLPLVIISFLSFPLYALENARVLSVVDGDTLKVNYRGRYETIRLIGIDAPESIRNEKARKDARRTKTNLRALTSQGREAAKFVKTQVKPRHPIRIEFDIETRDKYGRLLAYVYLSDGKMLNEEILKAGYANPMPHPPNVKYQARLLKAYAEAKRNRRGLWR